MNIFITNNDSIPHRKNNNTAVSDARPSVSQKWLFLEIRQLGSPTNVVSAPSSRPLSCRPTTARVPRSRASELKLLLLALRDCDATDALPCADAPKGLPAALCVCVAPQGPARQPSIALCLSSSLPLCLLFSPLPFLSKPSPSSHTHTQTPHISQCLPAAHARERTRRRSSLSSPRTATPRARRSKSCPFPRHII